MNLFVFCVMFFAQKGSFPAKVTVEKAKTQKMTKSYLCICF